MPVATPVPPMPAAPPVPPVLAAPLVPAGSGLPTGTSGPTARDIPSEIRVSKAAEEYLGGKFDTIKAAARSWSLPYTTLYGRVKGKKPRSLNGGKSFLQPSEEASLLAWCNWRISIGK